MRTSAHTGVAIRVLFAAIHLLRTLVWQSVLLQKNCIFKALRMRIATPLFAFGKNADVGHSLQVLGDEGALELVRAFGRFAMTGDPLCRQSKRAAAGCSRPRCCSVRLLHIGGGAKLLSPRSFSGAAAGSQPPAPARSRPAVPPRACSERDRPSEAWCCCGSGSRPWWG